MTSDQKMPGKREAKMIAKCLELATEELAVAQKKVVKARLYLEKMENRVSYLESEVNKYKNPTPTTLAEVGKASWKVALIAAGVVLVTIGLLGAIFYWTAK